ncbi:MAG TPA: hypothetical protein PK961_15925 [bacterium]|nr:hypothetical protein [bacterium]
MRRWAAMLTVGWCLALLGGCVWTSTAKHDGGEAVHPAFPAASDDAAAKTAALPQLVDLLSSTDRRERLSALRALAGPENATGSVLLDEAMAHPQWCPRLVKGLQNVWAPGDENNLNDLDDLDDYLDIKRDSILAWFDRQSCVDVSAWLWRQFADTPDDTHLGRWALEHDGEADNDVLIKLLAGERERYGRRKVYLNLLCARRLTLAQRARTLPVLKDRSLDPFERRNLACKLLEAYPRLNDELLLTALGDRSYPVAFRIIFLDFLSDAGALDVVRRIAEDPAEPIELRAKAREVLAGR